MPDTTTRWHHPTWLLEAPFYNKYDAIIQGKQKTAQKVDLQRTYYWDQKHPALLIGPLQEDSWNSRTSTREIADHQSDYIPDYYERAIREGKRTSTGHSSEQYWFVICTSTGLSSDQYWSTHRPVVVRIATLYKGIPPTSPTLFPFARSRMIYTHRRKSWEKYQIGDTPYKKFATFAVLQTSSTPHINITVL